MTTFIPRVRDLFDLPAHRLAPDGVSRLPGRLIPRPGTITLITGPSGGGKTQLLHAIRQQTDEHITWIDPASIELPDEPVIDCVCALVSGSTLDRSDEVAIVRALELLSRVGLAEAWTYLSRPRELSDGQRWRLILAMMIARAAGASSAAVIAMDEFAALLDRVTAIVVARALRKLIDRTPTLAAIVVTSHDDLARALMPDVSVVCDFGETRVVIHTTFPESPSPEG